MLHAGADPVEYGRAPRSSDPGSDGHPRPHPSLPRRRPHQVDARHVRACGRGVALRCDAGRYALLRCPVAQSTYGNYTDVCGLRNSHDRKFPVGIAFRPRVFVCDNLAFVADHVIRAKHTEKLKQRLPGLVSGLIEPLADHREGAVPQAPTLPAPPSRTAWQITRSCRCSVKASSACRRLRTCISSGSTPPRRRQDHREGPRRDPLGSPDAPPLLHRPVLAGVPSPLPLYLEPPQARATRPHPCLYEWIRTTNGDVSVSLQEFRPSWSPWSRSLTGRAIPTHQELAEAVYNA